MSAATTGTRPVASLVNRDGILIELTCHKWQQLTLWSNHDELAESLGATSCDLAKFTEPNPLGRRFQAANAPKQEDLRRNNATALPWRQLPLVDGSSGEPELALQ